MPDRENMPRWLPGDVITSDDLNDLASGVERGANIFHGMGVSSYSFSGTALPDREIIFVKVISQDGSAPRYAFREYTFDDSAIFTERDGGVDSYNGDGTNAYAMPLIEANSKTIPPDTFVWAKRSENGEYYVCVYGGSGSVTVGAADEVPLYTETTKLLFDENDGFVVTQPAASTVRVDFAWGVTSVTWGTDQTDYALPANTKFLLVTPTADITLNSVLNGVTGCPLYIVNLSPTFLLTLRDNDGATGTLAGRFECPRGRDLVLRWNEGVGFGYSSRWRCLDDRHGVDVEAADGSPAYPATTTLRFDESDGFVLSQPAADVVRVDLATQLSVTADASGVKLVNDSASPGDRKYYGTNSGGTKGFHDLLFLSALEEQGGVVITTIGGVLSFTFDRDDGIEVTDAGGGSVLIDLLPATTTQTGVVTTTNQTWAGTKYFNDEYIIVSEEIAGSPRGYVSFDPGPYTAGGTDCYVLGERVSDVWSLSLFAGDEGGDGGPLVDLSGGSDDPIVTFNGPIGKQCGLGVKDPNTSFIYRGITGLFANPTAIDVRSGLVVGITGDRSPDPPGSGGGSGGTGGGIVRTDLGTANSSSSTTSVTLSGVTCNAGTLLVVCVAWEGSFGGVGAYPGISVTFDGDDTDTAVVWAHSTEDGFGGRINYFYVPTDTTGDIVAESTASCDALVVAAVEIAGLSFNFFDDAEEAEGSSDHPDSGDATTSYPGTYWQGLVVTRGSNTDTDGTWQNSFQNGQEDGTADVKLNEGYRMTFVTGDLPAEKTGITSRPWVSLVAAFK